MEKIISYYSLFKKRREGSLSVLGVSPKHDWNVLLCLSIFFFVLSATMAGIIQYEYIMSGNDQLIVDAPINTTVLEKDKTSVEKIKTAFEARAQYLETLRTSPLKLIDPSR